MARLILSILLRTLICVVLAWYAFKVWGAFAIVFGAPLLGVLLARPLIDFVEEFKHASKAAALADVQGHWWQHRGHRIHIAEDADDARWLLVSDVRKILSGLPRDEVLAKQFGERAGRGESGDGFRIRADAMADYLVKSQDTASLKFKVWLDREVLGGRLNPRR